MALGAVYRKYQNGAWKDFVVNEHNQLHSAPGHVQWEPGLVAGYPFVQLTLESGGSNDADGLVKKTEPPVDPGSLVNQKPLVAPEPPKGKKSGGVISGMETGLRMLLMILVLYHRRRFANK